MPDLWQKPQATPCNAIAEETTAMPDIGLHSFMSSEELQLKMLILLDIGGGQHQIGSSPDLSTMSGRRAKKRPGELFMSSAKQSPPLCPQPMVSLCGLLLASTQKLS